MALQKTTHDAEIAIWERVFLPDSAHITPDQARYLLKVRFPQDDLERIKELSAKANMGTLRPKERAELDRYVQVGQLLSTLKAKIRGKLKKTRS